MSSTEAQKEWYQRNRERLVVESVERKRAIRSKHRAIMQDYKAALGCATCGEKDGRCLDFHHRNPAEKSFAIGEALDKALDKLWPEVEKCAVVCANCHRKLHGEEG